MTATGAGTNQLTFGQLEALWIYAGGDPSYAPTMAGVAFAESGGEPDNTQKGQPLATTGWGLWQITPGDAALNSPLANAQAAVAKFNDAKSAGEDPLTPWTSDPVGQVAIDQGAPLSLGQVISVMQSYPGLAPYTTNSVIMRDASANPTATWAKQEIAATSSGNTNWLATGVEYLGGAVGQGVVATGDLGTPASAPSIPNPIGPVDSLISWLSSHATRILEFVGGVMLIGLGLVIFFESTSTGQKITSDAAVAAAA